MNAVDLLRQNRMDPGDAQGMPDYLSQMQGIQMGPPQQAQQPMQGQQMPQLSPDQQMNRAAIQALMSSDYMKAGQFWQTALQINPQNPEAMRGLERVKQIMSQNTRLGRSTTEGFR